MSFGSLVTRIPKTTKLVQSGYDERVLKTFDMWNCRPVKTPLDANNRLAKLDCPDVVDPLMHTDIIAVLSDVCRTW